MSWPCFPFLTWCRTRCFKNNSLSTHQLCQSHRTELLLLSSSVSRWFQTELTSRSSAQIVVCMLCSERINFYCAFIFSWEGVGPPTDQRSSADAGLKYLYHMYHGIRGKHFPLPENILSWCVILEQEKISSSGAGFSYGKTPLFSYCSFKLCLAFWRHKQIL